MLRLIPTHPALTPAEEFGLMTLIDLSRLLVADQGETTALRVIETTQRLTIAECRARDWCVEVRDGAVELPRALLSLVTELVGAVGEQRSRVTDRFGRVPPTENVLAQNGVERDPVVARMAVALRKAAIAAARGGPVMLMSPWPERKRWAVALSHDLDVVSAWPAFTALRLAELLRKGAVGRAFHAFGAAVRAVGQNPVWNGARQLLDLERDRGIRSTWFIITGTPTFTSMRAGDVTYSPEAPGARRILEAVAEGGHELGLHGSFSTYVTEREFAAQRRRLSAIVNREVHGVRQHFLRMRPGTSHRAMAGAGFTYDSTFGFADRNGFRLGVADVVPVWDDAAQRPLEIVEVPFVWMDRALSKYRGVEDPNEWIEDAVALASICREVDGVWNGIWHPNLVPALGYPGATEAFVSLIAELTSHDPWSASMSEIVRWRRARRAARAVGPPTDGVIKLHVPQGSPALSVEDPMGRPVPHLVV